MRVLLFASLGPGVSWALHFNLIYFLTALYCSLGRAGADIFIYGATAFFLATTLLAGWTAFRHWRRLGHETRLMTAVSGATERTTLVLFIGMTGSVLFSLIILVEGLVPLFVRPCSLTGA